METKSKVLIGIVTVLVVALPMVAGVLAVEAYNESPKARINLIYREIVARFSALQTTQQRKAMAGIWFFRGAEAVTVEGTVVTRFRNILVVNTAEGPSNILLPQVWRVGSQIFNLTALDSYVGEGDIVAIKALQRSVTNNQSVTITAIVAYEIRVTNGDHLYAVLPFNIRG